MSKATDDVLAERQRQIEAEGWTEEHDDQHADGSMALAACCYASMAAAYAEVCTGGWSPEQIDYVRLQPVYNWPRSWSRAWWKPKNPRRDLVRAAALLIAEIERLDRRAPEETISIGQMFAEVMKMEAAQERFFPFEFEVWQGDNMVASASGPRDDALREAMKTTGPKQPVTPVPIRECPQCGYETHIRNEDDEFDLIVQDNAEKALEIDDLKQQVAALQSQMYEDRKQALVWRDQVAASQARETKLREAALELPPIVRGRNLNEALALRADDSALIERLKKEREREGDYVDRQ